MSELEGKLIGLYFTLHCHEHCDKFTPTLIEAYNKLKAKGENFEIVMISLDDEDEDFKEEFKTMPWLALPFNDEKCQELKLYFEVTDIPALVIVGTDGKTSNPNAVKLIKEHGIDAYPFTPEKLDELAESPNAKLKSKTLESPLLCGEKDFVVEEKEEKVDVSCCCTNSKNDEEEVEEAKEG